MSVGNYQRTLSLKREIRAIKDLMSLYGGDVVMINKLAVEISNLENEIKRIKKAP